MGTLYEYIYTHICKTFLKETKNLIRITKDEKITNTYQQTDKEQNEKKLLQETLLSQNKTDMF